MEITNKVSFQIFIQILARFIWLDYLFAGLLIKIQYRFEFGSRPTNNIDSNLNLNFFKNIDSNFLNNIDFYFFFRFEFFQKYRFEFFSI